MKSSRSIRLLFVLTIFIFIITFWVGFVFGQESQRQQDLVEITESRLEQETETLMDSDDKGSSFEIVEDKEDDFFQESQMTTSELQQPKFYMKESGEYVSVYVSATDELYFETDILVEDLPIELQENMEYGMDFYDLKGVYTFLENYSS